LEGPALGWSAFLVKTNSLKEGVGFRDLAEP
jgi:hypothetical protein